MTFITKIHKEQAFSTKLLTYISGIILLFACSQIYIPLKPIPITMQTVGIMLISLLYKQREGLVIYFAYLAFGAIGIPVFAQYNAGMNVLFGTSFGYFIGFLGAILVMNQIKAKIGIDSFAKMFINCLIGTIVIFFFGVAWLLTYFGIKEAIIVGLVPFIIPGIFKAGFLGALLRVTLKRKN